MTDNPKNSQKIILRSYSCQDIFDESSKWNAVHKDMPRGSFFKTLFVLTPFGTLLNRNNFSSFTFKDSAMTFSRSSLWSSLALCTIVSLVFSACGSKPTYSVEPVSDESSALDNMKAGEQIANQYIVVFSGVGLQAANMNIDAMTQNLCTSIGIEPSKVMFKYYEAVKGFAAHMTSEQAARLEKDPRVRYVEQDQVVKLDPCIVVNEKAGNLQQAQTTPWGITRVGGAGNGSFSVTGRRAWIIDTGIDLTNSDLNVDVSRSKTFITSGADATSANDRNGHGSHVSGIVAAKNNTIGVVGVAAGATVVAIKVLNGSGSGTNSGVIAGVDWVRTHASAGDVANMSLGGGVSTTLDNAVINAANAGIKFCLAAGNSSANANTSSPARANGTNIYTISAVGTNDVFAYFSNYGNPPVDYAAPGVSIYSLYKNGGTATMSGTSMASPHVAGILMLGAVSANGTATSDPDGTPDPIAHR